MNKSATITMPEIPARDRPISEEFRIVAKQWVDADAAASLLSELKTTTLEQMKMNLIRDSGPMADNKAEMIVKSSEEWERYIRQMVDAKAQANRFKVQMEYIRMKFGEWQGYDATARAEMRLSRS